MELELVTFEQAKALKELGFPQDIDDMYVLRDKVWDEYREYNTGDIIYGRCDLVLPSGVASAPTLELAAKWLREEKNILIEPHAKAFATNGFFKCFVLNCNKVYTKGAEHQIWWTDFGGDNVCFPNWETALSAGIDKAIELLKEE